MPDYVRKSLDKLQYLKPKRPQYTPHRWSVPNYEKSLQMAPDPYKSDILEKYHQENSLYCGDHALLGTVSKSNNDTGN